MRKVFLPKYVYFSLQLGSRSILLNHFPFSFEVPSTINHNLNTIDIIASMTSKIHHYASNIIRYTKSLSWILRLEELYAAQILHQAIRKLRGKEAR